MLNLKNTLDGYLKNVEVIGNTVQDVNNLADIRSVGDKVEGQELYNIHIQVDNGNGVNEVVEILSPVQLEKVEDVADRIICKDGVWGIEKNIKTVVLNGSESWAISNSYNQVTNQTDIYRFSVIISDIIKNNATVNIMSDRFTSIVNTSWREVSEHIESDASSNVNITISATKLSTQNVTGFKKWLESNNTLVKYKTQTSQFISLPHDQQIKLRTFAGQTNITFNTEIPGQIKAQVPKSLGATVNTHTEQIKDLHNSLDRVKKLEETTVSTVETESSFTTVDATSNGYFEDVKLEGKTLVNICPKPSYAVGTGEFIDNVIINSNNVVEVTMQEGNYTGINFSSNVSKIQPNTTYTVVANVLENTMTSGSFALIEMNDNTSFVSVNLPLGYKGVFIVKTTTRESYTLPRIQSMSSTTCISGEKLKFSLMVLEGDHTNNPPEYFEGLMSVGQDVDEVSVESVNENLFDGQLIDGYINSLNLDFIDKGGVYKSVKTKLPPGTYTLNFSKPINIVRQITDNTYFSPQGLLNVTKYVFNVNTYGTVVISFRDATSMSTLWDNSPIYLVRGNREALTLHQSNKKPLLYYNPTTETWEKPVLREWDSIEKHSDGKYYYHKRSGEVVLNGSEVGVSVTVKSNYVFYNVSAISPTPLSNSTILCNNFVPGEAYGEGNDTECIDIHVNGNLHFNILKSKLSSHSLDGVISWLQSNPTTVVYQLAQEEVYECTNIDLMTYSGETNYIINSGAISPKSLLKVHNNISNVVKILQEKVSLLENTFIAGLRSVLAGDMYSLATILYPEDFEQNDNIENDIMVIPE